MKRFVTAFLCILFVGFTSLSCEIDELDETETQSTEKKDSIGTTSPGEGGDDNEEE